MKKSKMVDAAGIPIGNYCHLKFNIPSGHGDYGMAVKALPSGDKLCVLCADGTNVAIKPCNVTVVDRSFMYPGLAVTLASDPDGQAGVVTGRATTLDLVNQHSGKQTRGVPTADVRRLTGEHYFGDHVVSRPVGREAISLCDYVVSRGPNQWLGRVVELTMDVDVVFEDGAVCRVTDGGRKLRTLDHNELAKDVFFQGQKVAGHCSSVFKASRWIKGYWKPSRSCNGAVAKSKVTGVLVYWLVASPDAQESDPPPAYHHDFRNLKLALSGNELNLWAVSNRCFFPGGLPIKRCEEETMMCVVTKTYTTVDVVWQDGRLQRGVPSASLLPFLVWSEHEFVPGHRVTLASNHDDDAAEPKRLGIVRSFNHKDKTARVSWFNKKKRNYCKAQETLSAYYLDLSLSHYLFYGQIVVRMPPKDSSAIDLSSEEQPQKNKEEADVSWVGYIVNIRHTPYIQVMWGDGAMSKVLIREIAIVTPQDLPEMLEDMGDWVMHDDDDTYDDAQEKEEEETEADNNDDVGSDDDSDNQSHGEEAPAAPKTMGWAGSVVQAMTRLGGNVLAKTKNYIVRGPAVGATENTDELVMNSNCAGGHTEVAAAATAPEEVIGGDGSARWQENTVADDSGSDESFRFPHFDVVQSPPDHHYLDNTEQGTSGGTKWIKRVQKEWKILGQDNLPDTIYVRAFEDRMDLFRAVMVGASGTPYHDGLFFFDLQLPPSYPAVPPLVSYRSFGLRLNPNLYESGTVCLSLLDTFDGEGAELWSPKTSNVLQVVVSIQGLVLTALPYYNEAGYMAQANTSTGRRNELPYSQNTYLLSLQTMLHLLRRPPAGFEAFIRDHFRSRGRHILRACEAYLDGCTVGTLDCEARPTELSKERPSSAGFRLALANIVPRLVQVFKEIDVRSQ